MDILGLGTVGMDTLMKISELPKADGFALVSETVNAPGGSGTNVIVQAARLGAKCSYIAQVGDDSYGKDIVASLQEEKIDTSYISVMDNLTSVHTDIYVDKRGDKVIMLNMGDAFGNLSLNDLDKVDFKQFQVFYTDLLPGNQAIEALKRAKSNGLLTAFNLQVVPALMNEFGTTNEMILDCLQYVDLFAPCRDGIYQLAGSEDPEACLRFIRPYFKGTLVITLGSSGSVAFDANDTMYVVPAMEVDVIDTTGAGDSYMGAMLFSYLLHGKSLEDSMTFATACASITCTQVGARSGPDIEETEQLLRDTK